MRIFFGRGGWGERDVDESIEAALAHPKFLRQSANTGDDYGARATEAEAERWEGLARLAQMNCALSWERGQIRGDL
jgi:hypothetical protein